MAKNGSKVPEVGLKGEALEAEVVRVCEKVVDLEKQIHAAKKSLSNLIACAILEEGETKYKFGDNCPQFVHGKIKETVTSLHFVRNTFGEGFKILAARDGNEEKSKSTLFYGVGEIAMILAMMYNGHDELLERLGDVLDAEPKELNWESPVDF